MLMMKIFLIGDLFFIFSTILVYYLRFDLGSFLTYRVSPFHYVRLFIEPFSRIMDLSIDLNFGQSEYVYIKTLNYRVRENYYIEVYIYIYVG